MSDSEANQSLREQEWAPNRHLRVVHDREEIDLRAAERAVADLLVALGADTSSEQLAGTPLRVARSYAELLTPREFNLTTFPNDERYDELVLAKHIPVQSLCEHHLLPFHGTAHVGYLPGDRGRAHVHGAAGVRAPGSRTVTSALHGVLREDPGSRQEFFALSGLGT